METTETFHIKTRDEFTPDEMRRFDNIFNKLPKPFARFDKNGLRYPVRDLDRLGLRIIFFPIEVMAEFVDVVTKTRLDSGEAMPDITFAGLRANYHRMNATSIGNLAYVALHSRFPNQKAHILLILEAIYKIEVQKRN